MLDSGIKLDNGNGIHFKTIQKIKIFFEISKLTNIYYLGHAKFQLSCENSQYKILKKI